MCLTSVYSHKTTITTELQDISIVWKVPYCSFLINPIHYPWQYIFFYSRTSYTWTTHIGSALWHLALFTSHNDWDFSMLLHMSVVHFFLLLRRIPVHRYSTTYSSICQLISTVWDLMNKAINIEYKSLCKDICVYFFWKLHHMKSVCLTSWEPAKLFFKLVVLDCIFTNNIWQF